MTPTNSSQEIEGRPYKEYGYSPVPVSSTSPVYSTTTLPQSTGVSDDVSQLYSVKAHPRVLLENMTEAGSKSLQYIATIAGNMCLFTAGTVLGWTSPTLPKLKAVPFTDDNPLGVSITEEEGSWVGALTPLGAIFGSFLAGYLAERCGRKKALLLSVVPFAIGWVLAGTAKYLYQIYAARFIHGIAIAIPFTAMPMYVGEIAETSVRGVLGSFIQFFITGGLLYSYSIGPYVSYNVLWIVCLCIPIFFGVIFYFMPESPYYLLSKDRKEEAAQSLAKFRGKSVSGVQKEIDEMQIQVEEAFRSQASYKELITSRANFKALMNCCTLVALQQLLGINVVLFYSESIFQSTGSSLSGSLSTIIIGAVQLLASVITPLIVDRLGRRILLSSSGIFVAAALAALGIFFYLKNELHYDVAKISWLPVVSLVIFILFYSYGWGPLPWTVMGEMFASDIKSKASGVTVCTCWLLAFIITKFFSNIEAAFGTHTAFWIFSVFAVLGAAFSTFILLETKGKSLQQIQDELNGVFRQSDLEIPRPSEKN